MARRTIVIRYRPPLDGTNVQQGEARVRAVIADAFDAGARFEHIEVERALWERPTVRLLGDWSMSRADVLNVLAECFLDAAS